MIRVCLKCGGIFEKKGRYNFVCSICTKENGMINADSIVFIRQQRAETGCRAAILNYIDSLFGSRNEAPDTLQGSMQCQE